MFAAHGRDLRRRRVAVVRLHRGDDAEPPEPGHVRVVDHLDVLDPVAPAVRAGRDAAPVRIPGPRAVRRGRPLERVERHPDAPIADRVQLHLPATPVGLGDERVQLVGRPRGQAGARVALVRGEDRGRPRVDDAVDEALEDAGVEVRAAAQRERLGLVRVEPRRATPSSVWSGSMISAPRNRRASSPASWTRPQKASSSGSSQASCAAVIPARVEPGDRAPDRDPVVVLARLRDDRRRSASGRPP